MICGLLSGLTWGSLPVFESLFEALFSYRPVVFQQGEFRFDVTAASLIATLVVAVVVGLAVLTYRRVRVNEGRMRDRIVLRLVVLGRDDVERDTELLEDLPPPRRRRG